MDFKLLFIHPHTGVLYAVVRGYPLVHMRGTKNLGVGIQDRIVMSSDGRDWKDISGNIAKGAGGGEEVPQQCLLLIFLHPADSRRICVYQSFLKQGVLVAVSDDYSDWKWHSRQEWVELNSGWSWDAFFAAAGEGPMVVSTGIVPKEPMPKEP
jgi:hypothetical protein